MSDEAISSNVLRASRRSRRPAHLLTEIVREAVLGLVRNRMRAALSVLGISWGIVSALTAFVTGPVQFAVARFLLGIGEAGFVPGVFLYISMWFPASVKSRAT